jgi:hypothetical protein
MFHVNKNLNYFPNTITILSIYVITQNFILKISNF